MAAAPAPAVPAQAPGLVPLLEGWLRAAEQLGRRYPELVQRVEAGSWPLALILGLAGLALLLGGLRMGRLVCCCAAAALGWCLGVLWAPAWPALVPPGLVPWVCAAVLGGAAVAAPDVYPVAALVVPGVAIGLRVPLAGRAWLGAVAGAVLAAVAGVLLRKVVVAATAALAGAVLVAAAALALWGRTAFLAPLAGRPVVLAAAAAALAIAGAAFQLGQGQGGKGGRGKKGAPTDKPELEDA